MSKEQEPKEYIMDKKGTGEVKIASDVVAIIAAIAATETDGVSSMAGNITNELVGKFGMKKLSKGVKVTMEDAIKADEIFTLLMGDEVEPRREFIQANAKYVKNLDI